METKTNQTEKKADNLLGVKTINEVNECPEPVKCGTVILPVKSEILAIMKIQGGKVVEVKQKTNKPNKPHYEGNPVKDYSNQKNFKEDNYDKDLDCSEDRDFCKYPEETGGFDEAKWDAYKDHLEGR